jgi:membrane protein
MKKWRERYSMAISREDHSNKCHMNNSTSMPIALPLYPKISSIYNKILQLAIAIVLLIVLMNLWLDNARQHSQAIEQSFRFVGQQFAEQTALSIIAIKVKEQPLQLAQLFTALAQQSLLHDAHLYDHSGQELIATERAVSIKQLYGISEHRLNISDKVVPFVVEINSANFSGYLRITLVKSLLISQLSEQHSNQQQLTRIMLLFAGVIGFLLTRGLSRFSRQGYRLASKYPQH